MAQINAEVLAGITYVQLLRPGHPLLMGAMPLVSDLRSGSMVGGAAELALMNAATAQISHFYGLPVYSSSALTEGRRNPKRQAPAKRRALQGFFPGRPPLVSPIFDSASGYQGQGLYFSFALTAALTMALLHSFDRLIVSSSRRQSGSPKSTPRAADRFASAQFPRKKASRLPL